MQTVLLTGANGFTGRHLRRMLEEKYHVVATARNLPAGDGVIEMDITRKEQVESVFAQVKPAIVIHLAAMSKPDECELNKNLARKVNVDATNDLLESAARHRSHFLFLSTDFVFGDEEGMHKEDDQRHPVNYYGVTKKLAEDAVLSYPYASSIIRTVLVYGDPLGGRDNIVTMAVKKLKNHTAIKIVNDQLRTPTYVQDLCKGILSVIKNKAVGVYHMAGKERLTPYEMVMAAADMLQLDGSLVEPVNHETFKEVAKRPLKSGLDISKAREVLGYDPVSFEDGLKRIFF